jgi:hypothetical protein
VTERRRRATPAPFEPPCPLPASGSVVLVGTNTAMDIVPPGMTRAGRDSDLFNS